MRWTSMLAIYVLFWTISLFVVLPWGIRPAHQSDQPMVPGQADSAPSNFRPLRVVLWTTAVSAICFGLFVANYVYGWVGIQSLNFFHPPAGT